MSLLDSLSKFGLDDFENAEIFEEEDPEAGLSGDALKKQREFAELEKITVQTVVCPVCDMDFEARIVRAAKVRMLQEEYDMRPIYKDFDPLKYDAIVCPTCGYAALSRYFKLLAPAQIKMIKEHITRNFSGLEEPEGDIYSYDEAIERYQLVLASALAKKAKPSEKAYICLHMAWLLRGKAETLPEETENRDKILAELKKDEITLLNNAYEGFLKALGEEKLPICGMEEITLRYLLGELARKTGKYEDARRWLSSVVSSQMANAQLKERTRKVWELVKQDEANHAEALKKTAGKSGGGKAGA